MTPKMILAADVTLSIDPAADKHPISRFIYGINPTGDLSRPAYADLNLTLARLGGNRWTAYNWLNNASNAGNDWHYSNDGFLDASNEPGHAVKGVLSDNVHRNAATIITVPINGYLAADKNGFVNKDELPQNSPRFVPEYPSASADPKPSDKHVYEDQFIQWIKTHYESSFTNNTTHPFFFMLDNEPDLWPSTHVEVHPQKPTYAEIIQRSIAYATAIKKIAPNALIFGPASYGWAGFLNFQAAEDAPINNAKYGDFLSYYLAQMKAVDHGHRLLDALDVHWYPEAMGLSAAGKQTHITTADTSPDVNHARMNAPRSLWDSTYVEKSWITKDSTGGKPIALLPRLNQEIATFYPDTKLSISEYNYGGGENISGAIAEADVLGLFGKFNIYAACEWPLDSKEKFILGAMRMFRNYDGHGAAFGDTSISAQSSNAADVSIYASIDSTRSGRMVLVAINRTMSDVTASINLKNIAAKYNTFTVYQLTSGSMTTKDGLNVLPTMAGTFPIKELAGYVLPGESVSTIILDPMQ